MKNPDTDFLINRIKKESSYSLERYFNDEIIQFHRTLPGYKPTPYLTLKLNILPKLNRVFLKDESRRFHMGAFKSLGASWAIGSFLKNKEEKYTFCTATDGNHGRAVAWSAATFGHSARVFVPRDTVASRIRFIENEGARVIIVNGDYDEAVLKAREESQKPGHVLIQDTSWKGYEHFPSLISAGYTTIIKEIEEQAVQLDLPQVIILQSGVGSWAAATILYLKLFHPNKNFRFIILEPYESDCLIESAKQQQPSKTRKSQKTIMAGLNCGTPSQLAWDIISNNADAYISMGDAYSEIAIRELHNQGIPSCESGAAGLGGLIALFTDEKLKKVREALDLSENSSFLVFNTEGITDPEMYRKITGRDN
jgi:diaminopropionate ammonia-lyase